MYLRSPEGHIGEVPDEQAERAVAAGYTPVSPEEVAEYQQQVSLKKDISGAVEAGTLGLFETSTLGFGPSMLVGASALLGQDPEQTRLAMAKAREEHPFAHAAGQFGGLVNPAGISARAGSWVARQMGARGMGAITQAVAREGTEGVYYGATNYLAERAVSGHDLDGETMFMAMVKDGAIGAGVGGAVGGVIRGMGAIGGMGAKLGAKAFDPDGPLTKTAFNQLKKIAPESFEFFSPLTKSGRDNMRIVRQVPELRKSVFEAARSDLDVVMSAVHGAHGELREGLERFAKLVDGDGVVHTRAYVEAAEELVGNDGMGGLLGRLAARGSELPEREISRLRDFVIEELGRRGLVVKSKAPKAPSRVRGEGYNEMMEGATRGTADTIPGSPYVDDVMDPVTRRRTDTLLEGEAPPDATIARRKRGTLVSEGEKFADPAPPTVKYDVDPVTARYDRGARGTQIMREGATLPEGARQTVYRGGPDIGRADTLLQPTHIDDAGYGGTVMMPGRPAGGRGVGWKRPTLLEPQPITIVDNPAKLAEVAAKSTKGSATGKEAAELYLSANRIRKQIEFSLKNLEKATKRGVPGAAELAEDLRAVKQSYGEMLEDSQIWGRAADIQRVVNRSVDELIPAVGDFNKRFIRDKALESFVKGEGVGSIDDFGGVNRKAWDEGLESLKNHAEALIRDGELSPGRIKALRAAVDSIDTMRSRVDELTAHNAVVQKFRVLEDLQKSGATGADVVGQIPFIGGIGPLGMGLALGPEFGLAAYGVRSLIKSQARPVDSLKLLHWLTDKVFDKADTISDAVNDFARSATPGVVRAAGVVTKAAFPLSEIEGKEASEIHQAAMVTSTTDIENILRDTFGESAMLFPDVLGESVDTAERAKQLMRMFPPLADEQLSLQDGAASPSDTFNSRYMNMAKAIQDPAGSFGKLQKGTLLPDEIMAIKFVYPRRFMQFTRKVAEESISMQADNLKLPYKTRINAGVLLDMPMDPMQRAQYRMSMATFYSANRQQQKQKGGKPGGKGSKGKKGDPAEPEIYMTGSEKTEDGEGR